MSVVDYTLIGLIGVAVAIVLCSASMWLIERRPDPGTRAARPRPERPLRPEDADTVMFVKAAGNETLADYARDTGWLSLPDVPRSAQDAGRGTSRPITGPGRWLRAIKYARSAGRSNGSSGTSVSPPGRVRPHVPGPARAGGPSTVTPFAPVTTAACPAADGAVKADSTGPGRLTLLARAVRAQLPGVRRGGMGAQGEPATGTTLPGANTAPPHTDVPRPGSLAEHAGPRHSIMRMPRRTGPVTLWTVPLLEEACQTAALLALAESILAGGAA